MKRTVLVFGLISGAILAALSAITIPLCMNGTIDFGYSVVVGYSTMVLSFALIVVGIRSYRDEVAGGVISFGRAFQVGILIALVASAVYVIVWEIVYFNFVPDFVDRHAAITIDRLRASGATDTAIAAKSLEMAEFKRLYANPLINVAFTFLEVFPVGLVITLLSAAFLRRKRPPGGSPVSG